MSNQPIGELMASAIEQIRDMVDANTVVGEPITTPDGVTVIPVSRMSFGLASGGSDKTAKTDGIWGGAGAAVRVVPVGFLVIKDGGVRMLNIAPPAVSPITRAMDLIPEIMDKIEGYIDKYGKNSDTEA